VIDVYRTAGKTCPPACMHCMTSAWMAVDYFIGHWFCRVCGECDCELEKRLALPQAGEGEKP
jgi:hypothetical protein